MINIAIINVNAYYLICKLKKAQIFIIFIKDLKFQAAKKVKPEINFKSFIPKEYYNLLDLLLKKNLNILFFYQKYDYKIILKEE